MLNSVIRTVECAVFTACIIGITLSNTSACARTSIDTFGDNPDPEVQLTMPQALADANEILKTGAAYFAAPDGTVCPGTYDELLPIIRGKAIATEMQNSDLAKKRMVNSQILSAQLTMISGACPEDGHLSGPVELLFAFKQIMVAVDTQKYFYLHHWRMNAVYVNGQPVGPTRIRAAIKTDIFNVLSNGEMIPFKSNNPEVMANIEGLSFYVEYSTFDSDSNLVGAAVNYAFSELSPKTRITVTRQVDRERKIKTLYSDSSDDGMTSILHLKSGVLHGWQETFVNGASVLKNCFQNSEPVKAVECPDT